MRLAFDRAGASAVRLCIAAAMVIRETCRETKIYVFRPVADLCKEMSTKGNDNGSRAGRGEREGGILASDDRWLERLRLELAWFTGQAALRSRGAGAILRLARVRPRRRGGFQPLREDEITPQFLDRAIRALKRWRYDFLGMDEVC